MKTFTPTIYSLPNPIGFDAEVYTVQVALAQISWMQAIFGVAHTQRRVKSEGESKSSQDQGFRGVDKYLVKYPQGRKAIGIDQDLSFDDSYCSRVFFLMKDDINLNPKTDGWNWVEDNIEIAQPFSIIFHCNLKTLEIDSSERLKTDILYAISKCPKLFGIAMFEDMKNVWNEFTVTPEINGITRFPNYCLRIDMICTYLAFPYNGAVGYYPDSSVSYRSVVSWKVCQVICNVVETPDGSLQTLRNGDKIPQQYSPNSDGTVTIPYLNATFGITVLSRFMLNGKYYQGDFFISGKLNTSQYGNLGFGDNLNFDASLPVWSI